MLYTGMPFLIGDLTPPQEREVSVIKRSVLLDSLSDPLHEREVSFIHRT